MCVNVFNRRGVEQIRCLDVCNIKSEVSSMKKKGIRFLFLVSKGGYLQYLNMKKKNDSKMLHVFL